MLKFKEQEDLRFTYTNYKGETDVRNVFVQHAWYGESPYHVDAKGVPVPQWFLRAYDFDKKASRDFAMKDMSYVTVIY